MLRLNIYKLLSINKLRWRQSLFKGQIPGICCDLLIIKETRAYLGLSTTLYVIILKKMRGIFEKIPSRTIVTIK